MDSELGRGPGEIFFCGRIPVNATFLFTDVVFFGGIWTLLMSESGNGGIVFGWARVGESAFSSPKFGA